MPDEKKLENSEENNESNEDKSSENKASESQEDKKASESDKKDKDSGDLKDVRKKSDLSPEQNKIIKLKQELKEANAKLKKLENKGDGDDDEKAKKEKKSEEPEKSALEKRIAKIEAKVKQEESDKNFNNVFDKWSKGNPERKAKKAFYQKIVFDDDPKLAHLETLDDIEKHFFPKSKDSVEGGSEGKGNDKGLDKIDFGNMTEEQRAKVYADPKAKKAYFEWMDSQS